MFDTRPDVAAIQTTDGAQDCLILWKIFAPPEDSYSLACLTQLGVPT